jgi:hypothetical protein
MLVILFQKPDTIKTNMANNISNKKTLKNIKKKINRRKKTNTKTKKKKNNKHFILNKLIFHEMMMRSALC